MAPALPPRPARLPLLESLSWFDADPYALEPLAMLRRYEAGWRHAGVLGDATPEELAYLRELVRAFGSVIDVPA